MNGPEEPIAADPTEFLSSAEVDAQLVERHPQAVRLVDAVTRRKRLLRAAAKWRQRHADQTVFAGRIGSAQPDVSRLESGKVDPKLSTLERYAAATGANFFWQIVDDQGSPVSPDFGWVADIVYRRAHPGLGPVPPLPRAAPPLQVADKAPLQLAEAINRRDYDEVEALYTEDAELRLPGGGVAHGRTEIAAYRRMWSAGFPDLRMEVRRVLRVGPTVFSESRVHGTHTGSFELFGVPATGRSVDLVWLDLLETTDGRISSDSWFFDRLTVLEELGFASASANMGQYA